MVLNDLAESSNLKETMLRNERLEDERLAKQYKMEHEKDLKTQNWKSHLQKIKDHVMRVLNRTDGFKLSSKRTPMEARMSQKMFPDQNTGFQVHPYNNLDK